MADIHDQGVRFLPPVIKVIPFRVAVKVFTVVQAGQMVPLRPADQVPVFGQFNAAPDPREDNLMPGIGF